jgi:tetratricopeptide (TPR) repeat protein
MAKPGSRSQPEIAREFALAADHYRQGRLDEAEKVGARILKLLPENFDLLHLLGVIKLKRGKPGAALGLLEAALKINPRSSDALSNRGLTLAALNRDSDALASFEQALALAPNHIDALTNRGSILLNLQRPADALVCLERVAALSPRHVTALINRGNALARLERLDEALAQFDALLAAHPAHPELHFNRGRALASLERHTDAIAAYDRALSIRPDYVRAHLSRGVSLQALNRYQEALASYQAVLALDKSYPDAQHNLALALLTLGDYRRGFELYEARWVRTDMPPRRRSLGKPLWLGEYPVQNRTILLHAEQGLGDTIQFVRYAPLLARMGAKVVLEVHSELASLLGRVEGIAAVVERDAALPAFDLHCPMGSLPLALRTEATTVPAEIPYLKANDERIARWGPRLAALKAPRVAIAWSGNPKHGNDHNRSIALARLASLFALEQASFISIQHELRANDAATLAGMPRITHIGEELRDFDDTAAVLSLVDLVISVDTSVANLAGAMGRPTWILLPFSPDWRWLLGRADSPWYPTARLYRQPIPGDWDGVIARVRDDLMRM